MHIWSKIKGTKKGKKHYIARAVPHDTHSQACQSFV